MKRARVTPETMLRAVTWMAGRDCGLSSKTICAVLIGVEPEGPSTPSDNADFARCYRLLRLVPEFKPRLGEVAERFQEWRFLVQEWSTLEVMHEAEIAKPDNIDHSRGLYEFIRLLRDAGRLAAGWRCGAPGCWASPKNWSGCQ